MKSNSKIHMYYTEGSQRARDYVGFNKQLVALPGCEEKGGIVIYELKNTEVQSKNE